MIQIDGSHKSGSGTIVRDAVPYAILKHEELLLSDIRAKRSKPGLRPQHLCGIRAATELSEGLVEGAEINSQRIRFKPGTDIRHGSFNWNIGTAGSTTMLALSIIPLGLFSRGTSVYKISGGLFQDFAPSLYHMHHVLLPLLKRMGASIDIEIIRPGYVPKGSGVISIVIHPLKSPLKPITMVDRGNIKQIKGIALASRLKERQVSHRMAGECSRILAEQEYTSCIHEIDDLEDKPAYRQVSVQPGAALAIWAATDTGCIIGSDMAGAKGRAAERIGAKVAHKLIATLATDATVDEHIADQLIPFAALAEGWSTYVIPCMTDHIDTRLWLARKILGAETDIKENLIRIRGIGYQR